MREYSESLQFKARDSISGTSDVDSTLTLVNDSDLPDEKVREKVTGFLEGTIIDFNSNDPEFPRELPAVYENDGERYHCLIYGPRNGDIRNVSLSSSSRAKPTGMNGSWETFSLDDTRYSVMIG